MIMNKMAFRVEGFTLIELMIVILIIAILVAIAVPVFLSARANAQKRTCQANLRTVDGCVQSYSASFGATVYPARLSDMIEPGTRLMKSDPMCPAGEMDYLWISSEPPHISCPNETEHTI